MTISYRIIFQSVFEMIILITLGFMKARFYQKRLQTFHKLCLFSLKSSSELYLYKTTIFKSLMTISFNCAKIWLHKKSTNGLIFLLESIQKWSLDTVISNTGWKRSLIIYARNGYCKSIWSTRKFKVSFKEYFYIPNWYKRLREHYFLNFVGSYKSHFKIEISDY